MEIFLIIVLIAIVVIMLSSLRNDMQDRLNSLQRKVDALLEEQRKMKQAPKQEIAEGAIREERIHHNVPVIKPEVKEEVVSVKQPEPKTEEIVPKIAEKKVIAHTPVKPPVPPKPPKPGFFERNPDLEKFIGENLANKIGIGVLVLGIGFFVKYAIDQDWINEIGRVFIGILCGGILLGVAHRLRNSFKAFSSVLVGGGIAVLYLTIAIAFHEYHIFNQTAAFIIMLVITGFAVVLSLGYNRIELAVLSILGGFASPFMVSTGEGNYIVLFTYILILDSGMLVLAYYKKWNLVNIISYVFTILLVGTWLTAKFDGSDMSMVGGAIIFLTLFYLVFFLMNIINNIRERTAFGALEIGMLLSNSFFYYGAGMYVLSHEEVSIFKGLFTAGLGVFNFFFAYALYKSTRVDRNLVYLLIGLVLTFVSLAAPVQLKGNYITLFWAAEASLLLWLSQKSGIRLMKLASVIVMVLMAFSLLLDWQQLYFEGDHDLIIVINKAYITGIVSLISMALTLRLLKNETGEYAEMASMYSATLTAGFTVVLYLVNLFELRHQLFHHDVDYTAQNIMIGCYNMLFILGMLIWEKRYSRNLMVKIIFSFWGMAAMVLYMFYYHRQIIDARRHFLLEGGAVTGFAFHYLFVALLVIIATVTIRRMRSLTEFNANTHNLFSWVYVFFFVFTASAELDHTVVLLSRHDTPDVIAHVLAQNHKIGYPILWGITSFILIAVGLKTKRRHLRIISLTLFLVTLLKLFIIDIRGISEGGKIAAFISLGLLLLVVSFMYQRLKKILMTDEPDATKTEENA